MLISPVGVLVVAALLALTAMLRAPLVVALLASFPFGATAFVTLTSLGGSSPLIFTLFSALFFASVAFRRGFVADLQQVMRRDWIAWVVVGLLVYSLAGAYLLPRMFANDTSVIVPNLAFLQNRPLMPVSGNITQPAYFALGIGTFFALCIALSQPAAFRTLRVGFLTWASVHAVLGSIDFAAKNVGAGDVLEPIRTASYSMLTNVEEAGFSRVTGAFSEASSFGGGSLICLAFTFVYWWQTGSRLALVLTITTFLLLVSSTSSSAYVTTAVLGGAVLTRLGWRLLAGRTNSRDVMILLMVAVATTALIAVIVYDERIFDPFVRLFQTIILNKAASASGVERAFWNTLALANFTDTNGLGIGMGSSRASSWPVAVLSQLGAIGALMMATMLLHIARGLSRASRATLATDICATVDGVRASALAALAGSTLAGSGADPGQLFFIALATVSSANALQRASQPRRPRANERQPRRSLQLVSGL